MIRVIVNYGPPTDPAAFDAYYKSTHAPLAAAMPHLKSYEVSQSGVSPPDAEDQVYLTAILSYASQADLDAALASPEGQAAVADLANFATGGVTILTTIMQEQL